MPAPRPRRLLIILAALWPSAPGAAGAQARLPAVGEGPVTRIGDGGARWKSEDGRLEVRLRGLFQADARAWTGARDDRPASGFLLRRARIMVEGAFGSRVAFRVMPDVGNGVAVLEDAFVDVTVSDAAWLRVGRMRTPFGQERARLIVEQFLAERSLLSQLTSNRDNGAQLSGEVAGGRVEYTIGVFNGAPDNASLDRNPSDAVDLAGRVIVAPRYRRVGGVVQGVGLGLNATTGRQVGAVAAPGLGSYATSSGAAILAYRRDGTAAGTTVADGVRTRWGAFGWLHEGPVGANVEYVSSRQVLALGGTAAPVRHHAWLGVAAVVLTGEPSAPNMVTPRRPFDPDAGAWGAFQLVGRVSHLALGDAIDRGFADAATQTRSATAVTVGLNWYVTRLTKALVYYELTDFEGGGGPGAGGTVRDRPDERLLGLRLQLMF